MQRCELGRTNTLLMYFGRFFRHPLSTLQLVFSFLPWIYDPQLHYYVSLSAVLFPSAAGSCFQKNKFWLFKSFLRLFIISTGSKQSSLWVHAAVQFSPLLCVLGPPEEPAYTHLCALVDNNETNYSTGYSADWSMVWPFQPQMAPLLQPHLGFMFPILQSSSLDQMGGKRAAGWEARILKQSMWAQMKSQQRRSAALMGEWQLTSELALDPLLGKSTDEPCHWSRGLGD